VKAAQAITVRRLLHRGDASAHGVPLLTGGPDIVEANDLPCEVEHLRAA
jgi:hypothetical protein